jgi:hypothetical protein
MTLGIRGSARVNQVWGKEQGPEGQGAGSREAEGWSIKDGAQGGGGV